MIFICLKDLIYLSLIKTVKKQRPIIIHRAIMGSFRPLLRVFNREIRRSSAGLDYAGTGLGSADQQTA